MEKKWKLENYTVEPGWGPFENYMFGNTLFSEFSVQLDKFVIVGFAPNSAQKTIEGHFFIIDYFKRSDYITVTKKGNIISFMKNNSVL